MANIYHSNQINLLGAVENDLLKVYLSRHGLAVPTDMILDGDNVEEVLDGVEDKES